MEKPCTYGKAHADDDDDVDVDDKQNKMLHYNRDSIKTLTRLHFNAYKSGKGRTYTDIACRKGSWVRGGWATRCGLSAKSINDSTAMKIQQQ